MKLSPISISSFQNRILEFSSISTEIKPWKIDKNPYKIWVFEIVMQQTRMEQGLPYFERLIAKFPTINALADASEDSLFSVWKGLGYYSRARNLQLTARHIVYELDGKFPNTYTELLKLKGVGEYTAAAIASFSFGENVAVLDGNVHRLLSRYFGLARTMQSQADKKFFQSLTSQLLIENKSALYNQAMMDMGSQVCKPQKPLCPTCVFSAHCRAFLDDTVSHFPPPKNRPVLKDRYFYCVFVEYKGRIYIEKRLENDIWKGLYQGIAQEGKELNHNFWDDKKIDVSKLDWSEWHKQTLSHQRIWMKIAHVKVSIKKDYTKICIEKTQLSSIPFPRIISRYFKL